MIDPDKTARGRFNPLAIFVILIFAVASLYPAIVIGYRMVPILFPGRNLPRVSVLPGLGNEQPEFASPEQRINILLMGLDQRRDEPDNTPHRTDIVMVLTMDPYAKTAGVFSIPRDTLLDIPLDEHKDDCSGAIKDRINVAYEDGEYLYHYDGGGGKLAKRTVECNFGIPIDYYVVLRMNNFIDLIDELGGVDINIPEYGYDPAYSECEYCGYAYPVEFDPGLEHMDGVRALAYARIRASDNDFKRIERQQLVLRATAKKATDLGTLLGSNPLSLYGKYKEAVTTDIGEIKALGLADLAHRIDPEKIRTISMAEATYPCDTCNGALLLWNKQKVEELKAQLFSDGRLQSEGAIVDVLNGTKTPELAEKFASFLRSQGMPSSQVSVDEYAGGELYNTTLIYDLSGKSYTVKKLAEWLGLPDTGIKTAADPAAAKYAGKTGTVIVVLGADANLPDRQNASGSARGATSLGGY